VQRAYFEYIVCKQQNGKLNIAMSFSLRVNFNKQAKQFELHVCYPENPEWDRHIGSISVEELAKRGPATAERDIGRIMLGAFDAESGLASPTDERVIELEKLENDFRTELAEQSEKGDPEAVFVLALTSMERASETQDMSFLEIAEKDLKQAAALGWHDAVEFLAGRWPEVKKQYVKDIEDNKLKSS
jgi:hypothetical protein